MKILYPLEVFYPSQAGGSANTVYWIANNLPKENFEPILVATNKGLPSDITVNEWVDFNSGKVIYVKTRSMRFPLYQTFLSIKNIFSSDIVHASSIYYPTSLITALFAYLLRKKLIWSVHGEVDVHTLNDSAFRKSLVLGLVKKVIGKYPIFHSTCDIETGYVRKAFGEDANVVELTNYFEVPHQRERSASKHLLFIGRLNSKKAIENLITALSLSQVFSKSEFTLKIAGDGKTSYKKSLQDLVEKLHLSDRIQFLGQVEGEEKHQLLADAYFTLMPSYTENFGLVVIESLAQGTPVIAAKGTPWKDLEVAQIGFWVENSPANLARYIDQILVLDPKVYAAYRERCRPYVTKTFDINNNVDKWIAVYEMMYRGAGSVT